MEDDRIKRIKRFLDDDISEEERKLFLQEAEKDAEFEKDIKLIALTDHILTAEQRQADRATIGQWQQQLRKNNRQRTLLIVFTLLLITLLGYFLVFHNSESDLSEQQQRIFALYNPPINTSLERGTEQSAKENQSLSAIRLQAHQAFTDKDFERAKSLFQQLLPDMYLKEEAEWMILLCNALHKDAWDDKKQVDLDKIRLAASHPYQKQAVALHQLMRERRGVSE